MPPVAVYIAQGYLDNKVKINILLTLLLWFPGVFHALYVVRHSSDGEVVEEDETVTQEEPI
ncbi:hypothetical protein METBIDRAFT_32795 [Metschnikowia bicuspidata var. bicuspidata NRRL YB-4993]|uniref:Uncharacterized protein n=1 Tax=Metschnikowia bicuspidata var. bicuspidata NRRL YB-4993 TaxID=869754 RepID=A0A1A0H742_9ASCO|nr:hypothetical protein METBIDRAFT_32795 [Metschnikowia bicuspidata var. bicuspidata NRRL YB-4993]OBA19722.1 hypothetical protein METBIDRAFT_32795 [Metschnikowia bicuspidata var. bicuspidata NRRL YB-4993]